jgi:hypothetical protein
MNTLTIPTNRNTSIYPKNLVLDIDKISFIVQESNSTTKIYTDEATGGSISLNHFGVSGTGTVGDALNNSLLRCSQQFFIKF